MHTVLDDAEIDEEPLRIPREVGSEDQGSTTVGGVQREARGDSVGGRQTLLGRELFDVKSVADEARATHAAHVALYEETLVHEFGMPVKESTRLVTTSETVSLALGLQCPGGHDHRQIKSTWRDPSGRRVNASTYCGGYTAEFATNILVAFEKQLKTEIVDCYTAAELLDDVPLSIRRNLENQRKKKLLDDVPLSIKKNLEDQRKKKMLDDVPLGIRRNLEPQQTAMSKEDKLKRRRYLLDDLPMSIKKELEKHDNNQRNNQTLMSRRGF